MFELLAGLPDEYYVFHSFAIVNEVNDMLKESETDFVIFQPKKGILCLEAKNGNVRYENNVWKYGSGLEMKHDGPFRQASTNKHNLMIFFEEKGMGWVMSQCKFMHGVWFPMVRKSKFAGVSLPPEAKLELMLTKDSEENIEKAVSLLEEDGWVLNGNGRREKDGVVLDLLLVYPEGNNIEPSLQKNLADNLAKAGIGLTMEAVPMDALLSSWYQQSERKADLMYLATNFDLVFDPTVHFGADGSWSYTGCQDTALQEAAEAMRRTDPGDVLNYLRRWVLFQERFNEVLPVLPVYSNRYYDFYTSDLQQYRIAEHITWGEAIVGAELKP